MLLPDELIKFINNTIDEKIRLSISDINKKLDEILRKIEVLSTEIEILKEGGNL